MNKKWFLALALPMAVMATDFTQMSTEELVGMRGTLSQDQRADFRAEMQKRMSQMTPQERQALMEKLRGSRKGQGMGRGHSNLK